MKKFNHARAYHNNKVTNLKLNNEAAIPLNIEGNTGIVTKRCWFGRARVIVETYSTWSNHNGVCDGCQYYILTTPQDIREFCHNMDIYPPSWVS